MLKDQPQQIVSCPGTQQTHFHSPGALLTSPHVHPQGRRSTMPAEQVGHLGPQHSSPQRVLRPREGVM